MAELKFEITKNIGVLSESARGWTKELNMVSWNEREPKYDLREWNPDHTRMGKGITLTEEEVETLKKAAQRRGDRGRHRRGRFCITNAKKGVSSL